MKLIRFSLMLGAIALIFVFGFGYGRWYSTRPASAPAGRRILYYVDPMHPWYKSDKPGTAPDCGMTLEPVYASGTPGVIAPPVNAGTPPVTEEGPAPEGAIQISPEKQQLMGMRLGQAEWTNDGQLLRVAGRVMVDETRVSRVHAKVEGWIERVFVDFTGAVVKEGQPLLTLYSPELLASQQELLLARKASDLMQHSSMAEASSNGASLLDAARRRLELWDLSRAQIDEIERTGQPVKSITIYSPASGYVATRNAFASQRVTQETELYTITDLSRVWVVADVFEADAPQIHLGQGARVTPPGVSRALAAKVSYLPPQIDPSSHTLKVRLDLPNAAMALKPDMYVDVSMELGAGRRLTVPADAVLDTGATQTVFLDRGNGLFEPRRVTAGLRIGDRVEIVQGLQAGERIVISAAFLLDSESQMKGARAQ
jgi:membrane fusion protein, copper/silver efflux system